QADIAVALLFVPTNLVHALHILQERADALQSIGDLHRDRVQVNSPALLEVGELGNLQSIQQHLPANAPRAQRGRLPVVFFKTDIVGAQIDSNGCQTLQVHVLNRRGSRLQD